MKFQYIILSLIFHVPFVNAQMVFIQEPADFKSKLEVASCYIIYKEKILFLKRCAASSWQFTWGLPGGKIESSQSPYDAMLREVFEETALDISELNPKFMKKVYVRDSKKDFTYYIFTCNCDYEPEGIKLSPNEHIDYTWLTPKQALEQLELVPGEDECIAMFFPTRW